MTCPPAELQKVLTPVQVSHMALQQNMVQHQTLLKKLKLHQTVLLDSDLNFYHQLNHGQNGQNSQVYLQKYSILADSQINGCIYPAPVSFSLVKEQLMLHIGTLILKGQIAL